MRHFYGASGYVQPNPHLRAQDEAQQQTGYGPILLRREGNYAIVEVEIDHKWIEVIRESIDSNFSHCVHPLGILEEVKRSTHSKQNLCPDCGQPMLPKGVKKQLDHASGCPQERK